MRVVAGLAGGRRLQAPAGRQLRPTSERVREAMFSSLVSRGAVDGARALDLFAGTGALGIEALSRGAESVTFVEADPVAVRVIEANLAATGLAGGTVVHADVARFLDDAAGLRGPNAVAGLRGPNAVAGLRGPNAVAGYFDLVLCDPPYAFDGWAALLARVPADLVVMESRRAVDPGPGWAVLRTARHGDTTITTVRRRHETEEP